jgi:hypothetical protein
MYSYFPLGIGVANIKPLAHLMSHVPAFVTDEEGGQGFAAFVNRLLAAQAV